MNHKPISKFHRLGTSSTKFPRNNNFTPLGTGFHNKPQNTITSTKIQQYTQNKWIPSYSQASQKFVSQTLALSNSTQASLLDFFSVKFDGAFTEFETFLDEGG
jgi:hypothetical protein